VRDAVEQAAHALGVPVEHLRYVVLDPGTAGGLGLKATAARIAVLVAGPAPRPDREAAPSPPAPTPEASLPEAPVADEARALVAALATAAGVELEAAVEETAEVVRVELRGRDAAGFLLGGRGEPAVLQALEHLLHGQFGRRVAPRRLVIECAGQRERREEGLRAMALELAAAVCGDERPRTTDPLNSYERRIVHMTLAGVPGVLTYSVGDGASRRVTVAPAEASLGGEVH
jgi:spoIIIJ-associated protein